MQVEHTLQCTATSSGWFGLSSQRYGKLHEFVHDEATAVFFIRVLVAAQLAANNKETAITRHTLVPNIADTGTGT